jgi:cell division protein FtsI (penicillin-binding protein 3)
MISILVKAIEEGTGQAARIPGFSVAGKTGTTQKFDAALGGYSSQKHLASFAGFVPSDQPAIAMIVVIDEPKGTLYYGGQVAAPIFREVAGRVLRYLGLFPKEMPQPSMIAAKLPGGENR